MMREISYSMIKKRDVIIVSLIKTYHLMTNVFWINSFFLSQI